MNKIMKILSVLFILCSILFAQEEEIWKEAGTMQFPVSGGAIVVRDSMIYIIGGYSDSLQANVNWIQGFNPKTETWNIVAGMKANRYGLQVVIYNNNLYIYGGVSDDSTKAYQLEVWNFVDDSTSVYTINQQFDRIFSTGFIYNDKIVIVGGYANFMNLDDLLPYIVYYDFIADSFLVVDDTSYQTGTLPIQQMGTEINDSYYLFGGDYNGVLQSYDIINYNEDLSYNGRIDNRVIDPRAAGYAISDGDSQVYLIGGYNESIYSLSTVEILSDISSSSVSREIGTELNYARRNLMAAVFENKMYVFGGESESGSVLEQIETLSLSQATEVRGQEGYSDDEYADRSFVLDQNYPNPFNPSTKISYSLENNQQISLDIYNILGERVIELFRGYLSAGSYDYTWDGKDGSGKELPTGVYFCRLSSGDQQIVKKMLLLK